MQFVGKVQFKIFGQKIFQ